MAGSAVQARVACRNENSLGTLEFWSYVSRSSSPFRHLAITGPKLLRLRALGGLALEWEQGLFRGAATQRRRLTLLAIIATAGKKGISRDRLLTLLWPDSDEAAGRHGLAQALYTLKRDLEADDLFLGTSVLGLNPAVISSDIEEFRDGVASGNLAHTVELYQGPLLDGVYLSGAPDFERWLDTEREALCRSNAQTLEKLATQLQADGDVAGAASAWNRLAAADPLNKRIAVQAMQALVASGSVTGALNHARLHELQRRDDLDMPGDYDVIALRDQISKTEREPALKAQTAEVSLVAPAEIEPVHAPPLTERVPAETSVAPLLPTAPSTKIRRPRQSSYWLAAAGVVAFAALAVVQGIVLADPAKSHENRIAVLPFTVRDSPRLSYLGDGMVDLLSQRLDGAGSIHTVDPNALLDLVTNEGTKDGELALGKAVARHFGAGQFVLGSVMNAGGKIQISATAYDAAGNRLAVASASTAEESDVLKLVDDLARNLVGTELRGNDSRLGREAAFTTRSLPALKAFLKGEQEFRAAHFPTAVESYRKAITFDSTFALAYYRLSTAAEWASQADVVRSATRQALRFRSRLSGEEQVLLDARMAAVLGEDDQVERLYGTALSLHPEDAEAWNQLGETVFHNGGWRGRPMVESRVAFERVASLRRLDVSSRLHLARLAALDNDRSALGKLAAPTLRRIVAADQALELNALVAIIPAGLSRASAFLDSLKRANALAPIPDESLKLAAWRVATYATDARSGQTIALMLTQHGRPSSVRLGGMLTAAHMAAAQGKWNDAKAFLDAASAIDPIASAEVRGNIISSGIMPAGEKEIRTVLKDLPATSSAASAQSPVAGSLMSAALSGRLAAEIGDTTASVHFAEAVALSAKRDLSLAALAGHMRTQIDARAAAKKSDVAGALVFVERGWPTTNPQATYPWLQSEAYTMAADRFLRARLLEQLGRREEALPWYETIAEDQGFGIVYLAPAYFHRAVIEEKLGRKAAAVDHYRRFISLWRDADPALMPQVRYARGRLVALGAHE